jgi:hypothetical protein
VDEHVLLKPLTCLLAGIFGTVVILFCRASGDACAFFCTADLRSAADVTSALRELTAEPHQADADVRRRP